MDPMDLPDFARALAGWLLQLAERPQSEAANLRLVLAEDDPELQQVTAQLHHDGRIEADTSQWRTALVRVFMYYSMQTMLFLDEDERFVPAHAVYSAYLWLLHIQHGMRRDDDNLRTSGMRLEIDTNPARVRIVFYNVATSYVQEARDDGHVEFLGQGDTLVDQLVDAINQADNHHLSRGYALLQRVLNSRVEALCFAYSHSTLSFTAASGHGLFGAYSGEVYGSPDRDLEPTIHHVDILKEALEHTTWPSVLFDGDGEMRLEFGDGVWFQFRPIEIQVSPA